MNPRPRTSIPAKNSPPIRGNFTNFLLLGFLAGLITANFLPAMDVSLTTTLAIAGLIVSLVVSKLAHDQSLRAERKASDRALGILEQRMDRLIPPRHIKAHGMHSHSPHGREDSESDGIPAVRRSKAQSRHSGSTGELAHK